MYFQYQDEKPYRHSTPSWNGAAIERLLWFWNTPEGQLTSLTDGGAHYYGEQWAAALELIRRNQSLYVVIAHGTRHGHRVFKCEITALSATLRSESASSCVSLAGQE
jgi:hypothetical protein